jgi:hypothetical protein
MGLTPNSPLNDSQLNELLTRTARFLAEDLVSRKRANKKRSAPDGSP